jgi:hypothetical protein
MLQPASLFFAQHVTKCKILHHSAKKSQNNFSSPPQTSYQSEGKMIRGKNFHALSARISAFSFFYSNVKQYKKNAEKTKNKQKEKMLTIIKYRS